MTFKTYTLSELVTIKYGNIRKKYFLRMVLLQFMEQEN